MSGMVGVIANDISRYTLFSVALTTMRTPKNTAIEWALTSDRILGRNTIAKAALDRGSEWLMFVDDDHVWPPDVLMRLLAHEQPVVGALYFQRMLPFSPIAYTHKDDEGKFHPVKLAEIREGDALVKVLAVGTGGMLIRSEVLRQMEYPWFEHGVASEDLMFCEKLAALDIPCYVDLGARLGHMLPTAVWPSYDEEEGKWSVGFTVADGFRMSVPIDAEVPVVETDDAFVG